MMTQPQVRRRARRAARKGQRGMTLIEIMVVITIIGLIASAVGVAVVNQLHEAKVKAARIQIKNFESALEHYRLSAGKYPTGAEGLNALSSPPNGAKPFMTEIPKDPWESEYVYLQPGIKNPDAFDLYSKGADGVEGGQGDGEDIGNF